VISSFWWLLDSIGEVPYFIWHLFTLGGVAFMQRALLFGIGSRSASQHEEKLA